MKISSNNKLYLMACKRESQFWEWDSSYRTNLPKEVNDYQNKKKYGKENIDDIWYFRSLGHFKKWLSIGSWWAIFELNLIKKGIVESFDFFDISKKAHETLISNAKKMWIEKKINTYIQDFNFLKLEENKYDLISCQNILHHLINLEEAFYEINKWLHPKGIFVIEEFIGEKKMYRSDTKMSIIKTLQTFLKEKYNIETKRFIRTNKKVLTNNCPFECVRSNEIYDLIQKYFWKNKLKESTFGHIFSSRWWIFKEYNPTFFNILELFDSFAAQNNMVEPERMFGIYRKSKINIIKSKPRTNKEIKENIGINWLNERSLLKLWQKIAKRMPWMADILKTIYFKLRG